MDIFNWFGSLLGYLLWFLYGIVQNYGVAIILFTIIVKALVFPLLREAAEIHGFAGEGAEKSARAPENLRQ